ncbi:MAG: HAMP domain-containing histidine kinase [Psychrosphaera sp.]|nr:HAMP domain-containing histidine kinase [Psychrosphaera sp.]
MNNNIIKRIPLLFLFVPTLFVAIAIAVFLRYEHRAEFESQLKIHARQVLFSITDIAVVHLRQNTIEQLKQDLWTFADSRALAIDNIVIFNSKGQFVTALEPSKQISNMALSGLPVKSFGRDDGVYYVYGRIGVARGAPMPPTDALSIGFVRVSFKTNATGLDSSVNLLIVAGITLFGLLLGVVFWHFRYNQFYYQLNRTHDFVVNLNKGYKQLKLAGDSGYLTIDRLQLQINGLVDFYEKRLTMGHFELSAIEQTLGEAQQELAGRMAELAEFNNNEPELITVQPSLMALMFQVTYQTLQAQLAIIEDNLNNSDAAQLPHYTDIIGATNQLNQMLGEVKCLADTAAGKSKPQLEFISISQLIASISQLVKPRAQAKSLEFIIEEPDHPAEVEIDVNQIQKVLIALMQCAVASTVHGFIKWTVEIVRDEEKGDIFYCQVQDSGNGLTELQHGLLRFDEVDSRLSDDSWITQGLRLRVAKKTVQAMGGIFKVKSLTGLGTEFTIGLPCQVSHGENEAGEAPLVELDVEVKMQGSAVDVAFDLLNNAKSIEILAVDDNDTNL